MIQQISNSNVVSIFNHPAWYRVLKKSYDLEIQVLGNKSLLEDKLVLNNDTYNKGIPFAIKKNKYVSLPFSDYIYLSNSDEIIPKIDELINNNPKIKIEIRNIFEDNRFEKKLIGYKHSLMLIKTEEEIFNSFKKTQVRQPIEKAIRDGLKAEIRNDYKAIEEFYRLHLITRKKLGVPIQPKKFFFHFWNEIIKEGLGYVVLVRINNKIISSGIFAGFNKIVTYKFSASHPVYLKHRPNNLMLWTGIQEAKRRGFEIFDFGRTDIDTEGLRKFKLGWGTVEEPLYYSYYPKAPEDSKFKFVKEKIVAPVIRYSPKFVCRLSGELLYKYFG